jgi:hypothetical protein
VFKNIENLKGRGKSQFDLIVQDVQRIMMINNFVPYNFMEIVKNYDAKENEIYIIDHDDSKSIIEKRRKITLKKMDIYQCSWIGSRKVSKLP